MDVYIVTKFTLSVHLREQKVSFARRRWQSSQSEPGHWEPAEAPALNNVLDIGNVVAVLTPVGKRRSRIPKLGARRNEQSRA